MVTLTVAFALQCINDVYFHMNVEGWLAMTTEGLKRGHVWQLFSFQFLHVSLWHLLGNVMSLWFLGRHVEGILGSRRFLIAYLICGFAGAALQAAVMLLFPKHFLGIVFGASAGTTGIFAMFAMMEGRSEIRVNFFLPIQARVLLYIVAGISLFFTVVPTPREGGVAHAAHLGGIIAGIAYLRWDPTRFQFPSWRLLQGRRRKRQLMQTAAQLAQWRRPGAKPSADVPPGEFISREVDPILDKISAHGIHSLTPEERKVLEAARAKMAKR